MTNAKRKVQNAKPNEKPKTFGFLLGFALYVLHFAL